MKLNPETEKLLIKTIVASENRLILTEETRVSNEGKKDLDFLIPYYQKIISDAEVGLQAIGGYAVFSEYSKRLIKITETAGESLNNIYSKSNTDVLV